MSTDPKSLLRAQLIGSLASAPYEELRIEDGAPDDRMTITACVGDLADAALHVIPADRVPVYPHQDDDTVVLGPGVYAVPDGTAISWKGVTYVRQEWVQAVRAAQGSLLDDTDLTEADIDRMLAEGTPVAVTEPPHSCENCQGVDPDTCWTNPFRPPEQCPRSESVDYGLQCQKTAGHNLCSFEETPRPDEYELTTGHLITCLHVAGGPSDPDCPACTDVVFTNQVWPLKRLLSEVRCGSGDWSWEEEWADLDARHAESGYLGRLEHEIKTNGITMPVLVGTDGRLWDGHHRLRIAVRLGIEYVPVEAPVPDTEHAAPHPDQHMWLVEYQTERGHWACQFPTHDRNKALDRLAARRAENPGKQWRLVRNTETYAHEDA